MRRGLTLFAMGLVVLVAALTERGWGQGTVDDTRRSMGNLRPDSYTAGRAVQGSNRFSPGGTRTVVVPQPYYGGYPHPYGYRPYYRSYRPGVYGYYPYYPTPYPYYYRPYVYPPPVFIPAETLYGPRAMRRFFGTP